MKLYKGNYYPRIGRPYTPFPEEYHQVFYSLVNAIRITFKMLMEIFQTVEPSKENQHTYGHNIRNLLLIICTEIENSWTGILKANNYPCNSTLSTNDYVKLLPVMKLDDYKYILYPYRTAYPDEICPFGKWSREKPTQSLEWYVAYNKTKHYRENNFHEANLQNVINAAAGLFSLGFAQFGTHEFGNEIYASYANIPFKEISSPNWKSEEKYIPASGNVEWKAINYPFS